MVALSDTAFSSPDSRHSVFVTEYLHSARRYLDRTLQPAIFRVPARARIDYAFQNFATLAGRVALSYIRLGGAVQIQPGLLRDFYMVQIPTKGYADIEYGGEQIRITPSQWSLLSPVKPVLIGWSPDCELLEIKIERSALDATLAKLTGVKTVEPIEFDLTFRGAGGRAESLYQLVAYICQQLELPSSPISRSASCSRVEELVLAMVLDSQNHNYSYALNECGVDSDEITPRFIRLAIEYMLSNADRSMRLADIAAASGVSVRALSAGFRRYMHVTPMGYLRDRRLDFSRAALQRATSKDKTVTQVAHQWGLHHLGRFARSYKKRFGESPSTTLKGSYRKAN